MQQVKDASPQQSSLAYPHSNPSTKVQTPTLPQQQKPASASKGDEVKEEKEARDKNGTADSQKKDGDANVIKNVVHIDQKGANINITNINNH